MSRLRRWWCKKYNLPSTHPSFQNSTIPDLMTEWYEDLLDEKEDLEARRQRRVLEPWERERIAAIDGILNGGRVSFTDPLIAKWEREIAEGKIPDLDEEG